MLIQTNNRPQTLVVSVKSNTGYAENIRIIVEHPKYAYTEFINRFVTANEKSQNVFLRLPLNPKFVNFRIFNERMGERENDRSFSYSISRTALTRKLDAFDYLNPRIASFIAFAEEFCYKAGFIPAGQTMYLSNDRKFCVNYSLELGGRTPARVSKSTKIIDVSRSRYIRYTIPMRFIVLLHEMSHVYLNGTPENEAEADLNALAIYLGLGYPRIEAYQAFTNIFKNTPTGQNDQRYKAIEAYIQDFEENRVKSISNYV